MRWIHEGLPRDAGKNEMFKALGKLERRFPAMLPAFKRLVPTGGFFLNICKRVNGYECFVLSGLYCASV